MQRSEIFFEKGTILRKEMLQDLYEYPRIITSTYYENYSDGILYGLEWRKSESVEGHHIISTGALKYHGKIYIMNEEIDIEEYLHDKMKIDSKRRLFFVEQEPDVDVSARKVYKLVLVAQTESEKKQTIQDKSGYFYAYVERRQNGIVRIDDNELYGLLASDDKYGYRIPNYILEKDVLPILKEKRNKHPLDFQIINDIIERKGLSLEKVQMYLLEAGENVSEIELLSPTNNLIKHIVNAINKLEFICHVPKTIEKVQNSKVVIPTNGGGKQL